MMKQWTRLLGVRGVLDGGGVAEAQTARAR